MAHEFLWPKDVDITLQHIAQLARQDIGRWIQAQRAWGHRDETLYLLLALASARYIDHHGPYIGHGTFNGGPVLRAATMLGPAYRNLALLQTATYVVDLLTNPNYGPYLLMHAEPYRDPHPTDWQNEFLQAIESGEQPLRVEHRLVALIEDVGPAMVRSSLILAGLRQFPENEHRLLIVLRAAQLLDDAGEWAQWAEPIFRPAVQYLASRPCPIVSETASALENINPTDGDVHAKDALEIAGHLLDCEYGEEAQILLDMAADGTSGATLYEAVALAGSEMMARSRFDAHAVTGIHCILDLLSDPNTPLSTRGLAWSAALAGARTRQQKALRERWIDIPEARQAISDVEEIRHIALDDPEGLNTMAATAACLKNGVPARQVAAALMEIALTTAKPFSAIHNVKMLWGQLLETERSRLPRMAWMHLAAAARVVAITAGEGATEAKPILEIWQDSNLHNA